MALRERRYRRTQLVNAFSLRAGLFLLCYSAGCAAVVPLSAVPFSRADMSNIGSVVPSPVMNVGSSPFQFSA